MLEALGFADVWVFAAQGRERSDWRADIYRWEGYASRSATLSCNVSVYSWDTMTKCVANGITSSSENSDGGHTSYQIHALEKKMIEGAIKP